MNIAKSSCLLGLSIIFLTPVILWSQANGSDVSVTSDKRAEATQAATSPAETSQAINVIPELELTIVPVQPPSGEEPYPSGTAIVGNELRLPGCAKEAWFEVRARNLGISGLTSGGGTQSESTSTNAAAGTCTTNCSDGGVPCTGTLCGPDTCQGSPGTCCTSAGSFAAHCPNQCAEIGNALGGISAEYFPNRCCVNNPCFDCNIGCPLSPIIVAQLFTRMTVDLTSPTRPLPPPPCKPANPFRNPALESFLSPPSYFASGGSEDCMINPIAGYGFVTGVTREILDPSFNPPPVYVTSLLVDMRLPGECGVPASLSSALAATTTALPGFRVDIGVDFLDSFIKDETLQNIPFSVVPGVIIVDPFDDSIPAVSTWGLVLIVLVLLVTAKICFGGIKRPKMT